MRYRLALVLLCLFAGLGAFLAGKSRSPLHAAELPSDRARPARLRSAWDAAQDATFVPSLPPLLEELGLPDGERYPLRVLNDDEDELLLLYPAGVEPLEVAGRWSLALTDAGYQKRGDWSRPGRTVLHFLQEDEATLLAVGRTIEGPFLALARPSGNPRNHWTTQPDEAAPEDLVALLPPPEPKEGEGSTGDVEESP